MDREQAIKYARVLKVLVELAEVDIILSTFIEPFKNKTILKADGMYYLHGNFNLGGTKSGRLSSSQVNLQNLPSTGSRYAKHIKRCFKAAAGWIMGGADFSSLEDKISALTTKDPNKLKVYTDGYDGHCLRAYAYFGQHMLGIVPTVESINSIETAYPTYRQDSKAPTFALTYQGTFSTLMNNCGFTKAVAKSIEANYHELYAVSDEWVQDKMKLASKNGYTTVAFGLRLRTPILAQTILGTRSTPYEAAAEGRTMGNAQGQSYGMLNNRAAIEFHSRLLDSPYAERIKPISHIHDAQYFLFDNNKHVVEWVNKNLIECMEWQELPEIQHPSIKLGGGLELYNPSWKDKVSIPNGAQANEIQTICRDYQKEAA